MVMHIFLFPPIRGGSLTKTWGVRDLRGIVSHFESLTVLVEENRRDLFHAVEPHERQPELVPVRDFFVIDQDIGLLPFMHKVE